MGQHVASPQLGSWLYWEQSLRSPLRSRHGRPSRASFQLMGAECGGQLHAWCKETLMQRCITNEKLAWIIDVNIWCPQVQFLELSIQCRRVWLAAVINDRCPNTNAFTSFIHKMGIFFLTSYAQQIQRQTCSKPQTKFLHHCNPASHFKMAPPKSNPLRL